MGNNTYLKPCSFCGSTSLKLDSTTKDHCSRLPTHYTASVRCNKCHARGSTACGKFAAGLKEAEERAIYNWNFRMADMEMQMEDSE